MLSRVRIRPRDDVGAVLRGEARFAVRAGDALGLLAEVPDGSVSLVAADPPYLVGAETSYLAWIGRLVEEWRRVLAPAGSLYLFASAAMAARVEEVARRHMRVLNSIAWDKPERGRRGRADRGRLRSYLSDSERVVFACRGDFLFEPIRGYLAGELRRSGLSAEDVQREWRSRGRMPARWFGRGDRWILPTPEQYEWLRSVLRSRRFPDPLARPHSDLVAEREGLRRPFFPRDPIGDVWRFEPVPPGGGDRHPHEKPRVLAEHVVSVSSRPGDVLLDSFLGSGAFAAAAVSLGRRAIGSELDPIRFDRALDRIESCCR